MGSRMEIETAVSGLVTRSCSSERAKNCIDLSKASCIFVGYLSQHSTLKGDGEPYILAVRISWYQFSN